MSGDHRLKDPVLFKMAGERTGLRVKYSEVGAVRGACLRNTEEGPVRQGAQDNRRWNSVQKGRAEKKVLNRHSGKPGNGKTISG